MAINPMQRKARQSFLIGVIVTLIVAAIIIFLLYNEIQSLNKKIDQVSGGKVNIYVLNQDVTSGQILTSDMFSLQSVDAVTVPVNATNDIYSTLGAYSLCDEDGNTIYTGKNQNGDTIMYTVEDGKQIIVNTDDNGNFIKGGKKIKTAEKPLMAKLDLKAKTVITGSMISISDEWMTDDVREQTYNMIALPIDLVTGDYVDIRLMLPNGTDFIVLSKLKVTIPETGEGVIKDTIKVNINEEKLLTMSSAIVEAYKIDGAKLYAIKYTEAGNQDAAIITYEPRKDIKTLIKHNPNIVKEAMSSLYNDITKTYRENQINKYYDAGEDESIISGIQESTTATQEAREQYLSTIYGY